MLLRVILAMEKPVEERIRHLIARSDVLLETVETPRKLWERLMRKSFDVVLGSRGFTREDPDAPKIRMIRELPDCP